MLGSCFVGSEKISKIWKTLMQVWITGYHGFSCEAIFDGLLTILTRLNYTSCFGQQIAIFLVEALSCNYTKDNVFM